MPLAVTRSIDWSSSGITEAGAWRIVALTPVAAGALYPFIGVLLSPIFAAGAMAISSVFVLGNALRLRRWKPAYAVQSQ